MALIAALAAGLALPFGGEAIAQGRAAGETLRYSISPTDEGFVRLDAVTGTMTHCRVVAELWQCDPPAYAESEIDARLRELDAKIEGLGAQLATLAGRVPAVAQVAVAPDPEAVPEPPIASVPEPAAETVPNFFGQVLHRLFTLVGGMKG